jgi:hypothetical protein
MANRLYFGDNLGWLRNTKEFPDASRKARLVTNSGREP